MPKVSIVLPTYNQERYISDAIESVLRQTYQDFEIIIVNDASSDQTVNCIQVYSDSRIRLFSLQQNQGESAATNFGIQQAQGEWIAILHSDDIFAPNKLEKQIDFITQNPRVGAVLSQVQVIDETGQILLADQHPLQRVFTQPNRTRFQWLNYFFIKDNGLCQTSSMIRRQCYEQIGCYDLRLRQIPDFDFWVRLCLQYEIYILPEPLIYYRVHDSNISGIQPETLIRHNLELTQILKHYRCPEVYQNFSSIFPDSPYKNQIQVDVSLAEFGLAIQALRTRRSPHQLFGLDLLYQVLNDPDKAQKIQQLCHFSLSDLKKMTGELDLFKIVASQTLKSQLRQTQLQLQQLETQHQQLLSGQEKSTPSPLNQDSENSLPLVSILIPTYNGEAFIAEALNSALSQTYPNLEIIVSDDHSTDNTLNIVQQIQRNAHISLGVFTHPNYGLVGNLNFCLKQAKGKYIKFLFQDDVLEPNCIEEMVNLAEQDSNIGLVFSPRRVMIAAGSESNPLCQAAYRGTQDLHQKWSKLQSIQSGKTLLADPNCLKGTPNKIGEPTTVLIPKKVIDHLGDFDGTLHQLLDVDLWFRILGYYNVGFVNQTLSCLRIHSGQQTQKNISKGQNLKDYQRFYQKLLFHSDYEFLSLPFKQQVLHKLLAKSQSYLTVLPNLIRHYHQTPTETITGLLRYLRQLIAEQWMKISTANVQSAYQGELGKAHQLLRKSHLQVEPLTFTEKTFVESVHQQLKQGVKSPAGIQSLLVMMLFYFPHKLQLNYKNIAIPQYLFQDFVDFLIDPISLFSQVGEAKQYLDYYQELLQYIASHLSSSGGEIWQTVASVYTQSTHTSFLKNYDCNLKEVLVNRAKIVEFALNCKGLLTNYNLKGNSDNPRIRLGIIINQLIHNWQTFSIIPILKNLDLAHFEIMLYHFDIENDIIGELCKNQVKVLKRLPETLAKQAQQLQSDDLDILWFASDLTTTVNEVYQLALHRLAPIQITSTTSPFTSGIRSIDFYLAGSLTLTFPSSQAHYQEQLIPLSGSWLCWSDPKVHSEASVTINRQQWGASTETPVFLTTTGLTSIFPELRQTWSKILAIVADSILVICPSETHSSDFPTNLWIKQMRSQFSQSGVDPKRLVVLEPITTWENQQQLFQQADVYLDGFPDSNVASVAAALHSNLLPVVQAGQTQHSKQAAAILKELGIPELIVKTEQEYIALTQQLAQRPQLRQSYCQRIQQKMKNQPPFLNSQAYGAQLSQVLRTLWQQRQSTN
jgi:glycosyltransferase involved in cell wall biosynthesis/predicted O-linked N-acetylglucosamine transferase (SPINDLY family)